jgi:hemolysin activation/secretion protein
MRSSLPHLRLGVLLAALLPLLGQPLPGQAQTTPADIERARAQAEREQQQEQQKLRQERERALQQREKSGIDPNALVKPGNKLPNLASECREMRRIVINGAANMSQAAQEKVTAPYLGKCLGVAEIEKLLSEITGYYIGRGFITTRVYLPSQDLTTGTLELLVLEGVLEKIMINDGERHSVRVASVFPGMIGRVVNLRDIEQGLDQINRLASNDAKMQIEPGSKPGASVLVVNNQAKKRFKINASYDNQGSETTGKRQAGLGFSLDNALGWDDFVSYTHREAVPGERSRRFSSSDALSYVLPYGYYTLSLNGSHSSYASTIVTPAAREFSISGDSDNASVRLDKVMYRNQKTRFTLAGTLSTKDSKNYLAGDLISVSSRKLSTFDLDSNYSTGLWGGVLGLDLGYARGLNQFGALRDLPNLPDIAPRAQFGKLKYGLTYQHPFTLFGLEGGVSSNLSGQRASDTLFGSEQILIGGIYSVRGFVNTTFSGDHGYIWRNDVSLRVPATAFGQQVMVKPYLALDHGQVSQKSGASSTPSGSLSGAAIGVSLQAGPATWEIFTSKPISLPSGVKRESAATYFRLSLAI